MMARIFVSIPVKDVSGLKGAMDELSSVRNVRASPANQIHITLRFIGDIDERRIPDVVSAVEAACSGTKPFEVSLKGAGCFPDARRPSVVWVGAEPSETLSGIAGRLSKELDSRGIDYDRKPFKSHVTIGRCRGPADIGSFLGSHEDEEFIRFRCASVKVMRSVLGPGGAKHTVEGTVMLE
jgi:2'-5' RNA ligase